VRGELLGDLNLKSGRPSKSSQRARISDFGLADSQSSRYQQIASAPDPEVAAGLVYRTVQGNPAGYMFPG
jgi:hypothetical protein